MCLFVFLTTIKNKKTRDLPGNPVIKTLCPKAGSMGVDLQLGNKDPTCHAAWPRKYIKIDK